MAEDAITSQAAAKRTRAPETGQIGTARHEALEQRPAAAAVRGYARILGGRPAGPVPLQRAPAPDRNGLPDPLKRGLEALSRVSLDGVTVHYNSAQPAQLRAHAFARGSEIHLAPGQDRHLPHEAWHVVQQAQGRVKPNAPSRQGVALNDDRGLEREADLMGAKAARLDVGAAGPAAAPPASAAPETAQLRALARLLPLCRPGRDPAAAPGGAVVQLVKVDVGDGEKEVSELSEKEMETLFRLQPMLTEALETDIRAWLSNQNLAHARTRYFENQLAVWKQPEKEAAPRKEKRKRPKGEKVIVDDMYSDSESDLSEAETDFDKWRERKPFGTTATMNRSHVPTADDDMGEDVHVTGMHHADTFMIVKQGGQFVPRTINAKPNVEAHRKPMPEKLLLELSKKRDDKEASSEEREVAGARLLAAQRQLMFGSAIDWEEGEYDEKLVGEQESHRKGLREEESNLGKLMRRNAMSGMRSGTKDVTHTDAEQRLLSSGMWRSMLLKLKASMDAIAKDPFYQGLLADNGIQLLLNRSSCLGCGKALALALVDFWQSIAASLDFKSWREARDHYAGTALFTIAFPVIYEYDKEKKADFANFKTILLGLEDAGWNVEAPKGIESNPHAEENHQKLKGMIQGESSSKKRKPNEVEGGEDPLAQVREHFEVGKASGDSNNCLLSTLYQLTHGTKQENKEGIRVMRDTLNQAGLAGLDTMIDLYGGAGQQLANDLHIRIQAIQIVGSTIVRHPILGSGGPLCFILHQGLHFSPLRKL